MKIIASITVIGKDRTGVVAQVTQYLFQSGANIEEIEQQVTRGQFSMVLQASWAGRDPEKTGFSKGLGKLAQKLGMEIRVRFLHRHARQRIALFVTREPGCPEAIIRAVRNRKIPAEIGLMVGNRPSLRSMAQRAGIPFLYVNFEDRAAAEERILAEMEKHEIDWMVLARFMKILSPNFVWRYKNKILNVHPSLLPSFPGASAYRQAYERGVKIVGVSAHIVTMDLDEGPIIAQDCFRVRPGSTLPEIVAMGQKLEARVLVRALALCLRKRLDIHWGVVHNV